MLFLGLLAFIVLTFVQPQEFVPAIKGLPLVYVTMAFVTLLWCWRASVTKRTNFSKTPQNILMNIFLVLVTISTLSLGWLSNTFNIFFQWAKVILIYFTMISIVDTKKRLKIVLWLIVSSMAVTAIMGILQYYGVDITGEGLVDERIAGVGIFGTNQLAYALDFCLPLAFGLLVLSRHFIAKISLSIILLAYAYCIYLTQSRGGQLCFLAVLLIITLKFSRNKRLKVFGVIFGVLLFMVLIKLSPRFSTTFEYQTDKSAMGRLDVWGEALSSLKDNPVLGIGYEQFKQRFAIASHNSYIQTVTELGLLGLFIWLALFYHSLKNLNFINRHIVTKDKKEIMVVSRSLQVSLYAYLVGSYFSSSAYYVPLYMLFALVVIVQKMSGLSNKFYFKLKDIVVIFVIEICVLLFIHILTRTSS